MRFADRREAGRRLAALVRPLVTGDVVVVGLPRGGVPVAFEVAQALGAPLDVIVVRKLGAPRQPELAMGAVGEGGTRVINDRVVASARVSDEQFDQIEQRERAEVERRAGVFRAGRPRVALAGRSVVVVDDGIATGATARAACWIARAHHPAMVVLAAPVGPPGVERRMGSAADHVVCLLTPAAFRAIGQFYADFTQVSDDEVVELLRQAAGGAAGAGPGGRRR